MSAPGTNGYAARLDGHDREIGQAREDRKLIWDRLGSHADRLAVAETMATNDRTRLNEIQESVEDGFAAAADGQSKMIRWLIATTCTGVGLIFTGIAVVVAIIEHV